ncbi:DNA-binding transcriptional LysR family regulator [Rhodobacter aestuarii]|uniref:DNA-binding transcriptional regulator, LysR family n=1 Tax=Rhodobacter aestuarii TaxID=453582 RepID=A0A1N7PJ89_9RHOB|nr:LysR family transcriptional regulator [Rhodobacter aestuarii]PTV94374.1 DNA-binding transcriptional LysR family regulator [Rhodobacter aestuarii]SIT10626.1 DNA-binding transcriptional regulator, LysR family [Rhodobacter aestuarii]
MTLEQLRIFLAVAEREHVTRAAEALHLTQSAVSAAVSALEARHGTKLFDRVGRGIKLTDAGKLFVPEARAVLARAAAAERVLDDLAGLARGSLRIAASQTLATYWLPPLVVRFHAAYPGIALDLVTANSETVGHEVAALSADFGFIEGGAAHPGLSDEPFGEDELYLVVAPGHPWAASAPSQDVLAAGPWIMREEGSGTRARMDEALVEMGVPNPGGKLEFPSNEAVRSAVIAGGGATLISRLAVEAELADGRLVRLEAPPAARNFRLLMHPERHLTEAAKAFLRLALPDPRL